MDEADRTLEVLRRAIRNEIAGQSFYGDAAFQCIDLTRPSRNQKVKPPSHQDTKKKGNTAKVTNAHIARRGPQSAHRSEQSIYTRFQVPYPPDCGPAEARDSEFCGTAKKGFVPWCFGGGFSCQRGKDFILKVLWAKETFATLAREKDGHARLLLAQYEALLNQGRWLDLEAAWRRSAGVDITRFTFPDDEPAEELFPPDWPTAQAIDRRTSDLEALAFAIRLEQSAIDLYSAASRATDDPAAPKAYHFLLDEDTRHSRQFKAQWERLAGRPFDEE